MKYSNSIRGRGDFAPHFYKLIICILDPAPFKLPGSLEEDDEHEHTGPEDGHDHDHDHDTGTA